MTLATTDFDRLAAAAAKGTGPIKEADLRWVYEEMATTLAPLQGRALDDDADFKVVLQSVTLAAIRLLQVDRTSRS
jgi:hypothetical protein